MPVTETLTAIDLPISFFKKGKVRHIYSVDKNLLMVASDRVSSFDFVLNQGIPQKGRVLTQISKFWFDFLKDICPNQLITANVDEYPQELQSYKEQLLGRSMLVKKTEQIPIECIVRGYIVGSGWKEYQQSGTVCGIKLPEGLKQAEKLPEPIFTPSAKAETGHDENISIAEMEQAVGKELTEKLAAYSLALYKKASEHALKKGIIIADTKFEFGKIGNEIVLIDEALTPDSSRFWPADTYQIGTSPNSLDKQIVRDYLENSGWDKQPPIPDLPEEVIAKTSAAYLDILDRLTK